MRHGTPFCLRFLLASRYYEGDSALQALAWTRFGWSRVQAICTFVHQHIRFDSILVEGGCRMSSWTATRIAEHTTLLLRDARLILVSNREPYSHHRRSSAPLARSADRPSTTGTTGWDFGWLRRFPAQVSRWLQGDHPLRWSQPSRRAASPQRSIL